MPSEAARVLAVFNGILRSSGALADAAIVQH
jgi:hypothetical protein